MKTKPEIIEIITSRAIEYNCLPALLSFCSNNVVCVDTGKNTTISESHITSLMKMSLSISDDSILKTTAKLVGLELKECQEGFLIYNTNQVEKLGLIIGESKVKLDGSFEKVTLIKESDTGLVKKVYTALLEKAVKFLKSPYGKCDVVVFKNDNFQHNAKNNKFKPLWH